MREKQRVLLKTVSRVEPLTLTVMHIRYDRSPYDCLAVKVCPFGEEAHYVEILLLGSVLIRDCSFTSGLVFCVGNGRLYGGLATV